MQPQPWPEVPAGTARVAKRAFRKGSLAMRARDELGAWCQDEAFIGAYGVRGAPGISPAQLAIVTVLQFTGDLTDRQAAMRCGGGWTGNTAWAWSWTMRVRPSPC